MRPSENPPRHALLALVVALAAVGCAPSVTEHESSPAADAAAIDGASRIGANGQADGEANGDANGEANGDANGASGMPRFAEGEVEHEAFVEPPIDLSALEPVSEDRPIRVVATVGQITDIVEIVGGDRVSVTQIVPGEDDPHLYVPTPNDVANLSRADVIVYNGLFLEGQMGETFARLEALGIPAVAATAGFAANDLLEREYSPGAFVSDPHVWFDPTLWAAAAGNVARTLGALDPDHAEAFSRNLEAYETRLEALGTWGADRIATIPADQRVLITSHDAFGYFGRRFGIEVVGLQGLSTEAEAGTQDVENLVDFIVERDVPAVFVEASVSPEALMAVTEAVRAAGSDVRIGGQLYSDTPGPRGSASGTYLGMVLWNLATITAALEGDTGDGLPPAMALDETWDYDALVDRAVRAATGDAAATGTE